ncbi:hypothetical protein ES705_32837 [subsurface metagenome]
MCVCYMLKKMDNNAPVLLAIPSGDGQTIFPKMLGRAKYFYVYNIENGMHYHFLEKRNNPYAITNQHLKTLDVFNVISDCKIIVSAFIGKKGIQRLRVKGVMLIFKQGSISNALASLINEQEKIYQINRE